MIELSKGYKVYKEKDYIVLEKEEVEVLTKNIGKAKIGHEVIRSIKTYYGSIPQALKAFMDKVSMEENSIKGVVNSYKEAYNEIMKIKDNIKKEFGTIKVVKPK